MIIRRFVEIATLAVSIGFAISLIYNYGFFYAIDIELRTLPITIADHLHTGALWFPELIGIFLLIIAIDFFFKKLERGMTEEEINSGTKNRKWWRKIRNSNYHFISIILLISVPIFALFGDKMHHLLPLGTFVSWYVFAAWSTSEPLIKKRHSNGFIQAYIFVPACLLTAFFYGYTNANSASKEKPVFVTIEDADERNEIHGKILRSFERGVLYMDQKGTVSFVLWSEIGKIRQSKKYQEFSGIVCEWFDSCVEER